MTELTFGYSPCPNDTYMFASIANGSVGIEGSHVKPIIYDVEKLNFLALSGVLDITKLSIYAYFKVKKYYQLLPAGGAIGFDCGPILISKKRMNKDEISNSRIVLPGKLTTAHLLFKLWNPGARNCSFVRYNKIFDILNSNKADCGVIIHESRFVFEKFGFKFLVDLGSWWQKKTGFPVPLGCIAAKKTMGVSRLCSVNNMLKLSLESAILDSEKMISYVKFFAQELSDNILWQHINTFVSKHSIDFGNLGFLAIENLHRMAKEIGAID